MNNQKKEGLLNSMVFCNYHSDHTVSRFTVIGSSTFLTDAIELPYEFMLCHAKA
jgi:hypothetical protein